MKAIKMKRKVLAILMSLAMAFTMMPSAAFAETKTWGNGDTEDETNSTVVVEYEKNPFSSWLQDDYAVPKGLYTINYKAGELKPFTFYNAYNEIDTRKPDNPWYRNPYEEKLTEEKKELFAKSQLKDWSRIATKIFSSQSQVGGGGGMSGVTWDQPSWGWSLIKGWSDMFENDDLSDIIRINLPDWLCKEDYEHIVQDYVAAHTTVTASGFQWADRLSTIRKDLIDDIAEETNHDRKHFENRDNNQGKTLSALDDDTHRDVYYSYVMWRGNELTTKYFNCYGIALYDFQYVPIEGDGLRYPGQSEQFDDDEGGNRVVSPLSSLVNEDTSDKRMEVTLEGQKTQTQQNVLRDKEGEECSYAYADRFAETFKNTWPVGFSDVKGVGNFHSALETTREEGKKVEYQTSDRRTVSPIVPAHTLLKVNEIKDKYVYDMIYDAASSLRFKVAIFSLTGSIGETGLVYSRGDFCTKFGAEGSTSANDDANSNLYERAVKRAANDETLARTEGYYKSKKLTNGVDWTHAAFKEDVALGGHKHPVKEVIENRATRLPMTEVGMVLYLNSTIKQQELGETVPLYYLSKFDLSDGLRSEYAMKEGGSYPIDALSVIGKNEHDVVYSGFDEKTDQNLGSWKVATEDPKGNPLDSGIVEITEDSETGKQKIKAKKAGTAYLAWELKETKDGKPIKFTSNDGKTVSAKENPPKYPYVRVQVMNESAIPDKIKFDQDLPDSIDGIAEESINLFTAFPVTVLNKDGEAIDHSCTYKFENEGISEEDASIDEYGKFIAHKPGNYEIKAEYYGEDEHGNPITLRTDETENKTINVKAARKLTLVPGGGMGKVAPDKDGVFSLKGSVEFLDQYNEPWKGDVPELKYTLVGSTKCGNDSEAVGKKAKIWGDQLVVDHKTIGDGDTFYIKAEAKGTTGVEPATFDYAVEPFPMADIPKAVSGLVFNGKAQTGVKNGSGYTLKGEKAVDVGWHEATATLDSHYKYWSDGSTDPVKKVKYYIGKATNPLKVKAKTATVKYKKLKKKTQTLAVGKVIKFTKKGQGKMSYKKASVTYTKAKSVKMSKKALKKYTKKAAKKITINAKTGKVTVKKGLNKGTYKVKVKVKAAGNANYKASAWKAATFKVIIK